MKKSKSKEFVFLLWRLLSGPEHIFEINSFEQDPNVR